MGTPCDAPRVAVQPFATTLILQWHFHHSRQRDSGEIPSPRQPSLSLSLLIQVSTNMENVELFSIFDRL